jgi:cell division protein FtsI/penicillin-binding protein 2
MKFWQNNNKQNKHINSNNRINLVIAVIFLLGAGILVRLYNLQVREYDLYAAKADGQHLAYSVLEPARGKIFVQDNESGNNEKLYPIANNKKFALVYAVPKDIKNPEEAAEKLYEIFKKAGVEKEVDELMKKDDEARLKEELLFLSNQNLPPEETKIKEDEIIKIHEVLIKDSAYLEVKNIKRETEIKLRKEIFIAEYLKILTKENDPYEPIEQKVDDDTLKKMYALLRQGSRGQADQGEQGINVEDLEIKDDKIIYKKENGDSVEIKLDGIGFIPKERRYYPDNNIGSHILGFVGYAGDEGKGGYGLEGFFNEELSGTPGSIKTERGAGGNLVIINDREYEKPKDGSDLILTINKTIQYTACKKLNEASLRHGADGGSVIIMEPKSGAILAMCSWPDYNPNDYSEVGNIKVYNNPAIFSEYEPGSIFKPITMAIAMDQEKITPETTYNDEGSIMIEGWLKPIKNSDYETHGGYGKVNMISVLENSLNTGAIFAMKQAGVETFARYVNDFGFGEKFGIEMETESAGNISNLLADKVKPIDAAVASFGQGISATPLQMAAAFSAIANGGILMKPYLVKEIVHPDGARDITQPKEIRRVISERASLLLSGMMVKVVDEGHGKKAGVEGYFVAGKTGTAQVARKDKRGYEANAHIGSFVGFAPADDPKFVMIVKIDNPRDVQWAESSAAPLFGEIAEFLLDYLEVPKER